VGISGSRVVVGVYGDDTGAADAGSAYIYDLSSPKPTVPVARLYHPSPERYDHFGNAAAIDGTSVVIGASQDDSPQADNGSVHVFGPRPQSPAVTTSASTGVTATSSTLGGTVTGDGGSAILQRGVVLSPTALNANPQLGGPSVTNLPAAGTLGVFTVNAAGLAPNTQYSFAAYAGHGFGTGYGSVLTFTTPSLPNTAPVAHNQTLATPVDTPLAITLSATDARNDPLTFSLGTLPPVSHGKVSGTGAKVTFAPAVGFAGTTSFSFTGGTRRGDGAAHRRRAAAGNARRSAVPQRPPNGQDQRAGARDLPGLAAGGARRHHQRQ
jgi:hypothetical protein